jgi:hypothetical protein
MHGKGRVRIHQYTVTELPESAMNQAKRGKHKCMHARVVESFTAMHDSYGKVPPPIYTSVQTIIAQKPYRLANQRIKW